MARRYSIGSGAITNTASTNLLAVIGGTTTRVMLTDLVVGPAGTAPADNSAEYWLQRVTSAGTGTAVTPSPNDGADPAAVATASKGTYSPQPTQSTLLFDFGVNLRATFRWCAVPGYEYKVPATASNGISLYVNAVNSAYSMTATFMFEE
jgi:hypothetical protein